LVRRLDDDLQGVEAFLEHYSITERDTTKAAMQDVAEHALSQYCSLISGVAKGLDLMYYPRRLTGSARGVIVLPVGEGNLRLNNMVNLAAVLNTELDHTLDKLGKVRADVAELRAELRSTPLFGWWFSRPCQDSAPLPLTAPWSLQLWYSRLQDPDRFGSID
jgi:hypothetical protein